MCLYMTPAMPPPPPPPTTLPRLWQTNAGWLKFCYGPRITPPARSLQICCRASGELNHVDALMYFFHLYIRWLLKYEFKWFHIPAGVTLEQAASKPEPVGLNTCRMFTAAVSDVYVKPWTVYFHRRAHELIACKWGLFCLCLLFCSHYTSR